MLYRKAFPIYRPIYSAFKALEDRAERRLLSECLQAGAIAVDAGANIGIYSRFLARCVGPTGEVHSFEPSPENFVHLAATASKLSNVEAHASAVGAATGEQLLYVSDDLNVDHRLYPPKDEKRETVSIKVIALDDYFPCGARVDLIKSDIQGYELHALQGAERVLSDNAEIKLLLEFWPYGLCQSGTSATALISFLRDHSFQLYRLGPQLRPGDGYRDSMDRNPAIYYNLFAQRDGLGGFAGGR